MNRLTPIVGVIVASLSFSAASVLAQLTITVDENGNGTFQGTPVTGAIAVEPISGLSTLHYHFNLGLSSGDVLLTNPVDITPQNPTGISDLIRFDAFGGNMYFFSLIDDSGPPDLADVPALPALISPNITVPENGPEGNNSAMYFASTPGQPGFDEIGTRTVQYTFISDVPEPGSALLTCAGAGLILRRRKGV